ncbi:hypothetical protein [Clostridium beijerinckii]|uniref:hypothetical protein n=1 Tax=Clostridium beijerinckii TaxID=1520 RepID=UPI001360E94E|nr:hypothetical protein [Clostridium beijerinckii]MZK50963.1 hypothetical protein [Clostridium beijerinckii]MZK59165.1 hypothetical protein [Clostridium beijerinckii]MZK69284.1 hypothetical protein [Clostridium beijerinckii]MZK74657.1 hypothetical protein [Clostridium beijerinckii]MZK84376.1 hypothetical protein [Clostridium beijerinckii]
MGKIQLKLDNSVLNKIKIESSEEMKNSFFGKEYKKAEIQLKDIIESQKSGSKATGKEKNIDQDINNNIIAFVGERGTGKSSVMLSFKKKIIDGNFDKDNKDIFSNVKFNYINNIDPKIMNADDSIMETIIGKMFKNYKDVCKKNHSLYERTLINCFEKVFSDLKLLNKSNKYSDMGDDLENLINTSSALSLYNNFGELVEQYLRYINENKQENQKYQYLLISIDDLDLELTSAKSILEDISKFLIQDNIIILMAVKFEQLEELIIQENITALKVYEENYINYLDDKNAKINFLNEARNKAIKYLEKILPYNRRIFLPKIDIDNTRVEFEDQFYRLNDYKKNSIKETIQNIYFKQYRYIIEDEHHFQAIIPNNLRGLIEFFYFLSKVEKIKPKEDSIKLEENPDNVKNTESQENKQLENNFDYFSNIKEFKNYYINYISNEIKSVVIKNSLIEFMNCPIEEMNKRVFLFINDYVKTIVDLPEKEEDAKDRLIIKDIEEFSKNKRFIRAHNVSLGNVVSWIKLYENLMESDEEGKIIELIKLIISIRYLEHYVAHGKYKLANITGRDFVGRYFELIRNKHTGFDKKIKTEDNHYNRFYSDTRKGKRQKNYLSFNKNLIEETLKFDSRFLEKRNEVYVLNVAKLEKELTINEEVTKAELTKINPLLDFYFNILYPQLQDQWKTRNSELYRNNFSFNDGWLTKYEWKKYWFKPLNIIGNQYLPYNGKENEDKVAMDNYIDPIILIINVNSFMKILDELNTKTNNQRTSNPINFLMKVVGTFNKVIEEGNILKIIDEKDKSKLEELMKIKFCVEEKMNSSNEITQISEEQVKNFLEININNNYEEMIGYKLDYYDDQGRFFLYYNWDILDNVIEKLKNINIEKSNIQELKNEINNILIQFRVIKSRIKIEKITEDVKKSFQAQYDEYSQLLKDLNELEKKITELGKIIDNENTKDNIKIIIGLVGNICYKIQDIDHRLQED